MLRHGVRALLERHGVEVLAEASDGRMAAAAARELHPDVAVLDIMMPLLNGIDAAREIAETCPDTQVVLLTASVTRRSWSSAVSSTTCVSGHVSAISRAGRAAHRARPGAPRDGGGERR